MKPKTLHVLGISLFLLIVAVVGASAMPQGRQVPLDQNLIQYLAKNGVDPTYLANPSANVPSDVLAKIASLEQSPDLTALILQDLRIDTAAFGNTLYLQLGETL